MKSILSEELLCFLGYILNGLLLGRLLNTDSLKNFKNSEAGKVWWFNQGSFGLIDKKLYKGLTSSELSNFNLLVKDFGKEINEFGQEMRLYSMFFRIFVCVEVFIILFVGVYYDAAFINYWLLILAVALLLTFFAWSLAAAMSGDFCSRQNLIITELNHLHKHVKKNGFMLVVKNRQDSDRLKLIKLPNIKSKTTAL